jgi:hypothetical protein
VRPVALGSRGEDLLTEGFAAVELPEAQFVVQKPYDVPLAERYEFVNGVRRMWVYANDKPISATHPSGARTEIKVDVRTSLYAFYVVPDFPLRRSLTLRVQMLM